MIKKSDEKNGHSDRCYPFIFNFAFNENLEILNDDIYDIVLKIDNIFSKLIE